MTRDGKDQRGSEKGGGYWEADCNVCCQLMVPCPSQSQGR